MSLQYNDTDNFKGIVQMYEREIGADRGYISGNTNRLKQFTADVNVALDDATFIAITADGRWQFDDTNQTDHPIIKTNLVDGQRDYTFLTDETGNLVLEVHRVFAIPEDNSYFQEIYPVDQQSDKGTDDIWTGQNVEGAPYRYDKTGNTIFLDPVPGYNKTNGLKVMITRESSYFASTDTSKKPGFPGLFHDYFFLKPAMDYARRNSSANHDRLALEVAKVEQAMEEYFGGRERDDVNVLQANKIISE